jgi:hypothetical protein
LEFDMKGMRRYYGIPEALSALVPSAQWSCRNSNYSELEWYSTDIEKPSESELEAKALELEANEPMRVVREIRDWYLQQCDWTQGADIRALRGQAWCEAWDNYRQQLRNLPDSGITPYFNEANFIQGVDWPQKPTLG